MVKYESTYTKGTLKKKKRSAKNLSNDAFAMFFCVCVFLAHLSSAQDELL